MKRQKTLSESECYHRAWDIRDGKATPAEARDVMAFFCSQVDERESVSPWLLTHLRDCFQFYLSGERTIDAALGVARAQRGRRKSIEASPDRVYEIAAAVLEHRIAGLSLEKAVAYVSADHHKGSSQIREMWRHNKHEGLTLVCINRGSKKIDFDTDERRRLGKIFPNEPWIKRAGKLAE